MSPNPTPTSIPHGGTLVNRIATPEERVTLLAQRGHAVTLRLDGDQIADLALLGEGAFSPLTGFLKAQDYRSVVEEVRLSGGLLWPIPVVLGVTETVAERLRPGDTLLLQDEHTEEILGALRVEELFRVDKLKEAQAVYGTTDPAHPGVSKVLRRGEVLLGGDVTLLRPLVTHEFPAKHAAPSRTREEFARRGWRTVVGFQTRNPVHRAHEYIQKCSLEIVDGLLLHPLVGPTKDDDVPARVRMECYETLLEHHYPADRVHLSVYPAAMRYAGPREALFHALVRKNYGCTHFIVGRDHAGVGNYYGPFEAHDLLRRYEAELGIAPIYFDQAFFCRACDGMGSRRTCPHDASHHVVLSGTRVRAMLQAGETPPEEFTRPEVASVLINHYASKDATERNGHAGAHV